MTVFDKNNNYHNNWAKKFEGEWTWVTVSFNKKTMEMDFYVNDELVTNMNGVKENKSFYIGEELKIHDKINPFVLGYCTNQKTNYKGQIAEVKIYNKHFKKLNPMFNNLTNLVLHVDFENGFIEKINNLKCKNVDVELTKENIEVIENIVPIRRESKFLCLQHEDEGFVDGKWKKGETTARNEKRLVMEMQQGLIDYKTDGLNNVLNVLEIDNIDVSLYENTKFINVKMK